MPLFSTHFQAFDGSGLPLSGALLYFYSAGTTTPISVYQDAAFVTPHASPVVADSTGLFAPIYIDTALGQDFKFVLQTAAGVTIQTADHVIALAGAAGTSTITYQDNGALIGPVFDLFRDSASPAAIDLIGSVSFTGRSSTGVKREYAYIRSTIGDPTNAAEYGRMSFGTIVGGGLGYTSISIVPTGSTAVVNVFAKLDISSATQGGQIVFPATQHASTDVNTLDDYEENTWTPTMTFNASTTGVTYSAQTGYYIKIGKMVTAWGRVTLTSNGSGVGTARIASLPFTADNITISMTGNMRVLAGGSSATSIKPAVDANATTATLYIAGAVSDAAATDTNVTDSFSADFTLTYQATA